MQKDRYRTPATWLLALSAGATLAGCAEDNRLPTIPATGQVVFSDGTPLPGGWIVCESPEHALAARGVIEADGRFELGTYEPGDGAVAGRHLVAITPAAPEGYDPDRGTVAPLIDQRFTHMDSSGLEIDVQPDGENHFELPVERSRP